MNKKTNRNILLESHRFRLLVENFTPFWNFRAFGPDATHWQDRLTYVEDAYGHLSGAQVTQLVLTEPKQEVRDAVIARYGLNDLDIHKLLVKGTDRDRLMIATHQLLSDHHLARLVNDSNPAVRAAVATHQYLRPALRDLMQSDRSAEVRTAAAANTISDRVSLEREIVVSRTQRQQTSVSEVPAVATERGRHVVKERLWWGGKSIRMVTAQHDATVAEQPTRLTYPENWAAKHAQEDLEAQTRAADLRRINRPSLAELVEKQALAVLIPNPTVSHPGIEEPIRVSAVKSLEELMMLPFHEQYTTLQVLDAATPVPPMTAEERKREIRKEITAASKGLAVTNRSIDQILDSTAGHQVPWSISQRRMQEAAALEELMTQYRGVKLAQEDGTSIDDLNHAEWAATFGEQDKLRRDLKAVMRGELAVMADNPKTAMLVTSPNEDPLQSEIQFQAEAPIVANRARVHAQGGRETAADKAQLEMCQRRRDELAGLARYGSGLGTDQVLRGQQVAAHLRAQRDTGLGVSKLVPIQRRQLELPQPTVKAVTVPVVGDDRVAAPSQVTASRSSLADAVAAAWRGTPAELAAARAKIREELGGDTQTASRAPQVKFGG